MQERQEFIDRYFVFSEGGLEAAARLGRAPTAWSKTSARQYFESTSSCVSSESQAIEATERVPSAR